MLPPGTLNALKGHQDGIVTVAGLGACLTATECGVPAWASIAALALSLGTSHLRTSMKERHIEALARRQMAEAMIRLGQIDINQPVNSSRPEFQQWLKPQSGLWHMEGDEGYRR